MPHDERLNATTSDASKWQWSLRRSRKSFDAVHRLIAFRTKKRLEANFQPSAF